MKKRYKLETNISNEVVHLYSDNDNEIIETVSKMMLDLIQSPVVSEWEGRPLIIMEVTRDTERVLRFEF